MSDITYDPNSWYWIIAGDASRAWSSANAGYVATYPSDRLTAILSEEDLSAVLRSYGLRGPVVSADDVRTECQRRIIAETGARDLISCMIKQSNANMRANKLNDKRLNGETLTNDELTEAAALRQLAGAIEALRAKSNLMEPSPPADFTDDSHWA